MLHPHEIVGLLEPAFQLVVEVAGGSDRHEVRAPARPVVVRSNHPRALQPSMKREARDEVILARREPGEADASHADEPRFLRDDLNVAERTQHLDESPGEADDRRIGAGQESVEREASARMP